MKFERFESKPLDMFIEERRAALSYLEALTDYIEDHMDTAPEDITWADVSAMMHIRNEARNLCVFCGLAEE